MLGKKLKKINLDLKDYEQTAAWCNENNAMIEDKEEYYEVVPAPVHEETVEEKIAKLKLELASTDYKCLKWIDGALLDEEYDKVRAYRADLRRQINELEKDV